MLSNSYISFMALFIGFMYSKGIRGFRLKQGYGIKNIVTALTWGVVIALYSGVNSFIIAFFTIKNLIITILNDFKDVEDDMENGIKTIPPVLGNKTTFSRDSEISDRSFDS